ncbi:hypothetical protein ACNKHL_16980 [Shigella flexneri]
MKSKSHPSLGGVSMGIAGSIVYYTSLILLAMKVQAVDMTELRRRIDQKFYDEAELEWDAPGDKASAMAKMKKQTV